MRITSLLSLAVLAALVLAGCAGPGSPPPASTGVAARHSAISIDPAKRGEVAMVALSQLDAPYRYGGGHPQQGFDCSGLVAYVMNAAADLRLPHNSAQIAQLARPVSKRTLDPGDLVFFNTLNRPYSHVGVYIGEGRFVNAPSSGGRVRIDSLANPYFAQRFDGARTLFAE